MSHLISVKLFQHLLNGTNRVAQITVAVLTYFGMHTFSLTIDPVSETG